MTTVQHITAEMAEQQDMYLANYTPGTPEFNAAMQEVSTQEFFDRLEASKNREPRSELEANRALAETAGIDAPDWSLAD